MRFSPLRFAALVSCVFALAAIGAPAVEAHAVIVEATPAVNAKVAPGKLGISLRYNSRIDHARSRLTLVGADGKSRALPIAQDGPADIISADVSDLAPGQYRLRWQVLAVDGHLTRGDIPFSVDAP